MEYSPKYGKTMHTLMITRKELIAAIEMQIVASKMAGSGAAGVVPKIPRNMQVSIDYEPSDNADPGEDEDDEGTFAGITLTWESDHGGRAIAPTSAKRRMLKLRAKYLSKKRTKAVDWR